MKFTKYSSIENTNRQKTIDEICKYGFNESEWEVSNKIHGANASVWFDGKDVKFAKRSGWIGEGENFYGIETIKDSLEEYIKNIWIVIAQDQDECPSEIAMYGELFGGSYPNHKSKTKAVQKGVYYSPDLQFYAFDLKVEDEYVDTDDRIRIFDNAHVPYSPIIFRGKFSDCLKYPTEFEDPTYKNFGLEKIENNMSEGVVIKPVEPKIFPTGSRVILKNKNPKFGEKTKIKKRDGQTQVINVSDECKKEIQNILEFVTENRLRNVLSHIGEVTQKDFGKVVKEFNEDVLIDYKKDFDESFESLSKEDQKHVTKSLAKASSGLLRSNFVNIIDGNF